MLFLHAQVISYQSRGGMLTSESISFNDMCDAYGVHVNPIKEHLHGTLWKRQNAFLDLENLPEDLVGWVSCTTFLLVRNFFFSYHFHPGVLLCC